MATENKLHVDPILRDWATHVPSTGWAAKTGVDVMNVLSALMTHLDEKGDECGMQLLARLWRLNNPVLQHIVEFDAPWRLARQNNMQRMCQVLDLEVGDDIFEQGIPKLQTFKSDAELLRGILGIVGQYVDGFIDPIVINFDDAAKEFVVYVGPKHHRREFRSINLRAALRLAIDDASEQVNG